MHDSKSTTLQFSIIIEYQIFIILLTTYTISLTTSRSDGYGQEFSQLILITKMIDICSPTQITPNCIFLFEIVKGSKPGINWRLDIFEFRDFVIKKTNCINMLFIFIVKVVQHNVCRRSDFDIFLFISEIIEKI